MTLLKSNHLCVVLLIVLTAAAAAGEVRDDGLEGERAPIVSELIIDIAPGRGDAARWESIAASMIRLSEGVPFSEDRLQESIETLKASLLFEEIDVPDPAETPGGLAVRFRLTPFLRIRAVRINGNFPVFEREVRNAMTFHSGGRFVAGKVAAQEAAVVELFKKQGYVDPAVHILATPDEEAGLVNLRVKIEKGRFFQVRRFEIEGNRSFSDFRLKLRTDAWKKSLLFGGMKRFVQKDLNEDVKDLRKFYRAKGYADAAVSARVDKDPESAAVDVRVTIEEGPRYKVTFEGCEAYWAWWTLRREMALEGGNRNDAGLRKSLRNIRSRYRSDGYLESRVAVAPPESEDGAGKTRDIRIVINEGVQSVVREIEIKGNDAFDDGRIRKQMLTRPPGIFADGGYDPRRLRDDIGAIKTLYLQHGYRETEVSREIIWDSEPPEEDEDSEKSPVPAADGGRGEADAAPSKEGDKRYGDVTLTIDEGVQTRVTSLAVTGATAVPVDTLTAALSLKKGEPYREYMLKNDEDVIVGLIAEQGYPFVQVRGSASLSADGTGAEVSYTVSEGRKINVGGVYFSGNFRTAEEVLRNELEFQPGDPFSARKLLESQRNIQDMGAVDSVRFRMPGLKSATDSAVILMAVEEKRPYWLELSLGYDTERHLFARVAGGDRNLFGRNKDLRGTIEVSQIGYLVDASLTEPRMWQSRISSTTSLFAEKREAFNQDFGTRRFGASQFFNRRFWDDDLVVGLSLSLERREQYMRDGQPIPEGEEDLYTPRAVFIATPSAVYNTTDSYSRPTRGVYASAFVDISKGLEESLDNFVKYRLESRYYLTPVKRLTFALRGRYGYIDPYGSASVIPDDQLFFLGGTSTVRGFGENLLRRDSEGSAVGGRESLLGNLEARYDLGLNLEAALFYDVGSIRKADGAGGSDDFRSSVGLGLRYVTPIGAVGLLYGWKLDPREGEDDGRLHFSIGYTF